MVVNVDFDGWDACDSTSDQHLGDETNAFDIESLWGTTQPVDIWRGDFHIVYAVRNPSAADPMDPSYRQDLFWGFGNFDTAELSKAQYGQTFVDVQGDESGLWHPFDQLFYDLVYKGVAANGNCFGMCLEANYALARWSLYSEPIHGVPGNAMAMGEINIKHGYQVGASVIDHVVGKFLSGGTHDPVNAFNESRDLDYSGNFPILSLTRDYLGGPGHAVRPYRWDQSNPNDWLIFIANPNDPSPGGSDDAPDNVIHVDPRANTFSFQFSRGETWSGATWTGGRMFALPYSIMCEEPRTPFWEVFALLVGGTLILLGGSGQTRQITDDSNRTFYDPSLTGPPTLWEHLARDEVRIPNMARLAIVAQLGRVVSGLETHPITGILGTLPQPVPEVYFVRGAAPPFGIPPVHVGNRYVAHFLGRATTGMAGGVAKAASGGSAAPAAPSGEGAAAGAGEALSREAILANPRLDQALPRGVLALASPTNLTHEIVSTGSGDYRWAMRSAGVSAVAVVPSAGDAANRDLVQVSKVGATDQALSLNLAEQGPSRQAQLTLVSSAAAGPDRARVFELTNVGLAPGQPFTAQLSPDAQEIHLTNPGPPVSFQLQVRVGGPEGAVASRPSVTVDAGKVAVIRPTDWTPAAMPTAPITMQVKDHIDGPVIQEVNL